MKTYKIKTAQVVVQQGKGVVTNAQHSAFAVLFESLDSTPKTHFYTEFPVPHPRTLDLSNGKILKL